MIDWALHHARDGRPIFPLTPGGKKPLEGSHGFKDATTDITLIEAWWNQWPDANAGLATGRRSGFLVIDIDPRKNTEWRAALKELQLSATYTVRTWSGGFHLYYKMPVVSKITIGADLLPGIDWRGEGGYVVAVGSVVNGATYMIERNLPVAEAPLHLIKLLEQRRKVRRVTYNDEKHMIIPAGERDDTLAAIAGALRRFGIEYPALYESLKIISSKHGDPPHTDDDCARIAASISRYPPGTRREEDPKR